MNVNSVETIRFENASAASDPYVVQQINNAEILFIAGGDQYVYQELRVEKINSNFSEINISALIAGTYFVKITEGEKCILKLYLKNKNRSRLK